MQIEPIASLILPQQPPTGLEKSNPMDLRNWQHLKETNLLLLTATM